MQRWGSVRRGFGFALAGFCFLLGGGAEASVRLTVQPPVLVADGRSTATVSVEVRDPRGRMARDGTEVRFTTTAGQINTIAFTSAGVARATLTAGTVPAAAVVTAFSGADQASGRVQMVSEMVEANVDSQVLRIKAQYVAFSEELRFLDSIQDVRVKFRGLTIEANAIQIDVDQNSLRAFGRVGLISGEKVLEGERLFLNLQSFDGVVVSAEKKTWFNGYGLNELAEQPKTEFPEFEFKELTRSALTWVGKEAVYIPGVKVQVRGARAYVGGVKSLRIPFHEARLDSGLVGDFGQYIGAGSEGLVIDIPVYVGMTPNASTAVHFRHGERTGFGYFNGRPGFGLDLEEKYGIPGRNDGMALLSNVTSAKEFGFRWNHMQQFGKGTRVNAAFETPAHRDLFGQFNLAQQLGFGNVTASLSASKLHEREFGRSIDLGFETKPAPLLSRKFFLSFGTRYSDIGGGQFEQVQRRRFEIEPTQTEELFTRLRADTWRPLPNLNVSNSVTLRHLWGTSEGLAFAYNSGLNYQLPFSGTFTVGYNYNQVPTVRSLISQARQNLSATLAFSPGTRFRASVFGTYGLDTVARTLSSQMSFRVTNSWRLDLLQTFYQFAGFSLFDTQFGVARKIGQRELVLFYSTRKNKVLFEIAAGDW